LFFIKFTETYNTNSIDSLWNLQIKK
jgi:hypothetical protein